MNELQRGEYRLVMFVNKFIFRDKQNKNEGENSLDYYTESLNAKRNGICSIILGAETTSLICNDDGARLPSGWSRHSHRWRSASL
jgi:hypothetical protein